MGLIQMAKGAINTTLQDAVKEYFRCDGMTNDILALPATLVRRDGVVNNHSDRVISNGSIFDVAINQAALLVENGKVHDFVIATDETMTGQYKYDSTVEPSLLGGGLHDFVPTLQTMVGRFTAGGQSTNTMYLVYINLKEIIKNPVGVGNIAFMDKYLGTRLMLAAHGYYTFAIKNPIAFYENLVMDANKIYKKEDLLPQLKQEIIPKVQAAITNVSPLCVNGYQDIYAHDEDIASYINEDLKEEWLEGRGIKLINVALSPELSQESKERVEKLENAKTLSNKDMAIGSLVSAQGEALVNASKNEAGALNGFLGMGLAAGAGGIQPTNLVNMLGQESQTPETPVKEEIPADAWVCPSCGKTMTGKFCNECGTKKPEPVKEDSWTCPNCGKVATGKFCNECGTKRPEAAVCPKCGAPVTGKFCNECGEKISE